MIASAARLLRSMANLSPFPSLVVSFRHMWTNVVLQAFAARMRTRVDSNRRLCRYMTWDKALFPKPEELQNNIASRGRKMVTIVDPHIKRDQAYPIFKNAEEKGYYVRNKDGKDYDGCA